MRKLLILLSLTVLTACGFQLRGNYALPFETLHITLPESNQLHATLKRNIEASSKTRIEADPSQAQAILTIISDLQTKNILSLSSRGRVREFQLVRAFTFRVHDIDGRDYISQTTITLRRDLSFSDDQVLSKEAEEGLLYKDMQNDLVQQIMRRLSLAKLTPVAPLENATTR